MAEVVIMLLDSTHFSRCSKAWLDLADESDGKIVVMAGHSSPQLTSAPTGIKHAIPGEVFFVL